MITAFFLPVPRPPNGGLSSPLGMTDRQNPYKKYLSIYSSSVNYFYTSFQKFLLTSLILSGTLGSVNVSSHVTLTREHKRFHTRTTIRTARRLTLRCAPIAGALDDMTNVTQLFHSPVDSVYNEAVYKTVHPQDPVALW